MALTPKLTKKWWDDNKPKTLLKTGISKGLLEYEMAKEKRDEDRTITSLDALSKLITPAITKCDDKLHKDICAALQKYPQMIKAEKKLAEERKEAAKKAAKADKDDASVAVPKQKLGKPVVIWERDIALEVLKVEKCDWLDNFKGWKLALTLNDDILDVLEAEGDHTTPAFMVEDAQKLGAEAVDEIVKMIRKIDAATAGRTMAEKNKLRGTLEQAVKQIIVKTSKQLEKVPEERWKKFVARHKQYRDYQIKAGVNVTIGALASVVLVAGIAASQGAALVIGIVALTRTVSGLVKQCYDLAIDADTVGKDLKDNLDTLEKQYKSAVKQVAKEMGGTVLKAILSVDAPFIATLPKCDSQLTLWDNKIAGVTVAGREASKGIVKLLKACGEAEERFKKANGKEAEKVYKKLAKGRVELDKALNSISDMMAKVGRFEKNAPGLKKVLEALQDQNPKYADIFDKVLPSLVSVGLAAGGAGVGFAGATDALGHVSTAIVLFDDLATEGKAKLEEYLSA